MTYYLVIYNILSTIGWGYIFISTFIHVSNLDGSAITPPKTASSTILNLLKSSGIISGSIETHLPTWMQPVYQRSTSTFARVGTQTAFVQSFALLEVVHALLGWVRSPLQTTVMQVASRLFLVWGVIEQFENVRSCEAAVLMVTQFFVQVRTNPLFASMVLAWSMTEIIRYAFYACNLLGFQPYVLLYLRYTTFYILYPVGAFSEAFLIYATLPKSSPLPGWQARVQEMWKPTDYFRALMFCIWWPGMTCSSRPSSHSTLYTALYVLYTYMIAQRRKVLRSHKLRGAKAD